MANGRSYLVGGQQTYQKANKGTIVQECQVTCTAKGILIMQNVESIQFASDELQIMF